MKKRIIALLITLSSLLSLFPTTTFASSEVKVAIDGNDIEFDVKPQIINGRTMVPMRKIFEELGATVEWNGETKTITGKKDDITVILQIGKNSISVNGRDSSLDTAPCIVNNTTLVPARAIAESFGVDVNWYGDIKTVAIYNDTSTIEIKQIFDLQGDLQKIDKNFVEEHLDVGWAYDTDDIERVRVYHPDGTSKNVFVGAVADEVSRGWYTEPVTTMYALDGRVQVVPQSQVEANKQVGWYTTMNEVTQTLYSLPGTITVYKAEIPSYLASGWYTEHFAIMYAPDGRTQVVPTSQVEANKNVGWYTTRQCDPLDNRSIIGIETCADCNGSGTIVCKKCDGDGWYKGPTAVDRFIAAHTGNLDFLKEDDDDGLSLLDLEKRCYCNNGKRECNKCYGLGVIDIYFEK